MSTDTLSLAGVIRESIVDGPGFRFVVFCQGCPHDCPGCHNPATHSFEGGKETKIAKILEEVDKNPILQGVTFSGGEPFCQAEGLVSLAEGVKKRGLNLTIFTGYTWEELQEKAVCDVEVERLLKACDLLIDGKFVENEKDLTLKFRGSKNQRIIDMQATRLENKPILVQEYM